MNEIKVKKGDTILYNFAFKTQEARVVKVYSNGYIKVMHKGFSSFFFTEIIETSRIKGVSL